MTVNNCIKVLSAVLIMFGYSNDGYSTEQNGNIQSNSPNRLQRARPINEQIMKQINQDENIQSNSSNRLRRARNINEQTIKQIDNEWLEDRLKKTLETTNISYSDPEWKRMEVIQTTFEEYRAEIINKINSTFEKSSIVFSTLHEPFIEFLNSFEIERRAYVLCDNNWATLRGRCKEYSDLVKWHYVGIAENNPSIQDLLTTLEDLRKELLHQVSELFTKAESGIHVVSD